MLWALKLSEENPLNTANLIASKTVKINGKTVDISKITKKLLSETCMRQAVSRPMSQPAITPLNFCFGVRIKPAPRLGRAASGQ